MTNSITTITNRNDNSRYFLHNRQSESPVQKKLTKNQRLGIQVTTALGVIGSIALLAKTSKTKYSFNLSKILSTPFKDTFLGKEEYTVGKILTIGAGSCLGGLAGGMIFDTDKNNRQSKLREALIQYTNISVPIGTVALMSKYGGKLSKKVGGKGGKLIEFLSPVIGLAGGILAGNKFANKLNNMIFDKKEHRPVELLDMSPHLDDICMASQYIAKDNILTKCASRFIPLTLLVAGNEIGRKQEKR